MNLAKTKRRNKRQAKKLLRKVHRKQILEFLWEQFLGIEEHYYPSKDPSISNHKRVIGQRILSGRIRGGPVDDSVEKD